MENKSYWIWHYGEYEIYHMMQVHLRRQEFGVDYPPFWHIASPYVSVEFLKFVNCESEKYIKVYSTGKGYVLIDDYRFPLNERVKIPVGEHCIKVAVFKECGLPAIYAESDIAPSNSTWLCNHHVGEHQPVGWNEQFDSLDKTPEIFPFSYENKQPVSLEKLQDGTLYDFGTELFGYLNIKNADKDEKMGVFYGESREEALDTENSILLEYVEGKNEYRLIQRAFRYIYIKTKNENLDINMDYEYLPLEKRGDFKCNNELFNKIYDISSYTFHLNCREGFFDGIKRDRWVWSGDAYQSARINAYLFADSQIVKRTALGLIGKEPIEQHINTIVDYSLLWIIGLYEYYLYYGDFEFISRIYPKAVKLLKFCETRLNSDGFIEGIEGDWTFIDWSDIDKTGAVCAEQMLLIASYNCMAEMSGFLNIDGMIYADKGEILKKKVNEYYWNEEKGAFIDSYASGKNNVTRHANIFAVMYDIATPEQVESITKNVLKNDSITKITTPYFEGYELDVLAKIGDFSAIENMIDSYWGGMIKLGAKTVWEEFDPELEGIEHYKMYGNKYAKSLCHAWGAGSIYLFGKYYLGVSPTSVGFESFIVKPCLGGLEEISGTVPINGGSVKVFLNSKKLSVFADKSGGTLIWNNEKYEIVPNKELIFLLNEN
ncbi:MAG: alpha-rhamnosidase [Clostridia bacterium]|nr:alpha-rhamnosidase [Clostridia bacterium]